MAFLNGSSLRKDDVLRTLERIGDEEALRIYRAYLNGRKTEFDVDFLRNFVLSRVEKMAEKVGK